MGVRIVFLKTGDMPPHPRKTRLSEDCKGESGTNVPPYSCEKAPRNSPSAPFVAETHIPGYR
eukprot:640367-Rhodomonas_salina.1